MPIRITKNIEKRIIELLVEYKHLRDSDDKLVATLWCGEIGGREGATEMTSLLFLQKYANGELTTADTITRIRRKVQTEHPELRGEMWAKKKAHEIVIETQLGYHSPTPEPYPDGNGYKP